MHINPVRLILAAGLALLALRYLFVLIDGYDVFEGNNDPETDWMNYVTGGALGFEVAKRKGFGWAILAGVILAITCECIRWLLIIPTLASRVGWEYFGERWQYIVSWVTISLIVSTALVGLCALAGALLSRYRLFRNASSTVS